MKLVAAADSALKLHAQPRSLSSRFQGRGRSYLELLISQGSRTDSGIGLSCRGHHTPPPNVALSAGLLACLLLLLCLLWLCLRVCWLAFAECAEIIFQMWGVLLDHFKAMLHELSHRTNQRVSKIDNQTVQSTISTSVSVKSTIGRYLMND